SMFDVRCSMFDVRCSMLGVGCSMFDVRCSTLDVGCWMLDVGCSTLDVGCSELCLFTFRAPKSALQRSTLLPSTLYCSDAPTLSHPADSAPPSRLVATHACRSSSSKHLCGQANPELFECPFLAGASAWQNYAGM